MTRVLEDQPEDLDCRVQAGVTRAAQCRYPPHRAVLSDRSGRQREHRRHVGHTSGSGTNAVRYGTMRGNILGLTVVTPDGPHHQDRHRAKPNCYDLRGSIAAKAHWARITGKLQLKLLMACLAHQRCGDAVQRRLPSRSTR